MLLYVQEDFQDWMIILSKDKYSHRFYLTERVAYISGYRIGRNTHNWGLCHDLACSHKGSSAINFLGDLADNTQPRLCIWEVKTVVLLNTTAKENDKTISLEFHMYQTCIPFAAFYFPSGF